MSRSRNIKPGFFKNDLLAECSPLARILFIGLWCEADREGRLEDRAKRIKADCLPYDHCDVDALLDELDIRGFIHRYEANGSRYIAIPEFVKHQNPHCKEQASTIPAPCKHSASTVQAQGKPDESTEVARLIPDSLLLIPDSLKPQEATPIVVSDETPIVKNRFDEFWSVYPLKKGKAMSQKTWKARKLDTITDRIIADVLLRAATDRQWLDGYIPHGSSYINGKVWEDSIEPRTAKPMNGHAPSKTFLAIQRLEHLKNANLDQERDLPGIPEIDDPRLRSATSRRLD